MVLDKQREPVDFVAGTIDRIAVTTGVLRPRVWLLKYFVLQSPPPTCRRSRRTHA
ncbi:hypothetical protein SCLCIDRAFT_1223879 [Scleroderma citrinum Foug A]|uniref:Uncharacterized protein n=1 Tax=Scleroderma citrinum Foug A TaxID=1036808 RepID=A0A0C2YRE2_9AGAM|nr:hypothetical protein SCLCIDRAFT_1223879 [Scleroderma citrinum Foug A]